MQSARYQYAIRRYARAVRKGEKVGKTGSKMNNLGSTDNHPSSGTVVSLSSHNHFNCCKMLKCISFHFAKFMGGVAGAQDEAAKPAAKKPTAKEILEEEKRSG